MNFHPRASNAGAAEVAATVVAVEPAFDFGGADYRTLHANSDATVFQSPAWLDALHRDVAPAFGASQATVTVRDQDLRLMMVLPLVRRRQHGVTIVEFADFAFATTTRRSAISTTPCCSIRMQRCRSASSPRCPGTI
jgi:CelD/BcsL family acetyltransferase involved in cellulose biosynthesis